MSGESCRMSSFGRGLILGSSEILSCVQRGDSKAEGAGSAMVLVLQSGGLVTRTVFGFPVKF